MKLNRLTLRFTGESSFLEQLFLKDYCESSISHIQTMMVLGGILYAVFGILDALLMPEQMFNIWWIRFIIIGPGIGGTLFLSCFNLFKKHLQAVLAFVFVAAGGGIICMILIAPPQVSYSYYAGLMLVFMWGYSLIRLSFLWAAFAGWFQVILYEIAAIWINPTPVDVFVSNNFFFISANLIGMMTCYVIEIYARRDFFRKQQLENERENVSKMNEKLENRVANRTYDYQIVNEALLQEIEFHEQSKKKLQQTLNSLKKSLEGTIKVMVSAVEARDPYTAGHQMRTANLASAIAKEMGLDAYTIKGIKLASSIHDIGKLAIPAEILTKPASLNKIEYSLIKEHSAVGYKMLNEVESQWPLADIVHQHHERINGSGYPRQLKGDEIILEARILAVSDVVESIASHRPYRSSLGLKAALDEIAQNKGILYDDAVVDACLRLFHKETNHDRINNNINSSQKMPASE